MVECDLAKVEVAGSNPVSRSNFDDGAFVNAPLSCTRVPERLNAVFPHPKSEPDQIAVDSRRRALLSLVSN